MYGVCVKSSFSAAHRLREYEGRCEAMHGHNWSVEVHVRGADLNKTGMLVDFKAVREALKAVLDGLDHHDLNETEAFRKTNPTSENIARHIFGLLSGLLNADGRKVHSVRVYETEGASAAYWEEGTGND